MNLMLLSLRIKSKTYSLINIVWGLWFGLLICSVILKINADNVKLSASKIKTNISKMNKQVFRSNTRLQNLVKTKLMTSPIVHKEYGCIDRNQAQFKDMEIFEVHIRLKSESIWTRFKDIAVNKNALNNDYSMIPGNGSSIEQAIMQKLLGSGMGGERCLKNEISSAVPEFEKVSFKDISFGCKFIPKLEDNIKMKSEISEIKYPTSTKPSPLHLSIDKDSVLLTSKTIWQVLNDTQIELSSDCRNLILSMDKFAHEITLCPSDWQILIFSDGSAMKYENLKHYTPTAGLVIVCANDKDIDSHSPYPLSGPSIHLKISSSGYMIKTPFDCELLGGLASQSIISSLVKYNENRVVIHSSDSKPLIRILKQSFESNPYSRCIDTESTDEGNLKNVVSYIATKLSAKVRNKDNIKYTWKPGHPERRIPFDKWSLSDQLIWTSDYLSKSVLRTESIEEAVNLMHLQYKKLWNIESNNVKEITISCKDLLELCSTMTQRANKNNFISKD